MKTPKEYTDNLKKGIVTDAMMQDVLYSYSKRAKNYRDRIRDLQDKARWNPHWYDKYGETEKCELKRDEYYMKKGDLLKHCDEKLTAVHRLTFWRKRRVYDYEAEYDKLEQERKNYEHGKESKVVHTNSYYDRDQQMMVDFCDIREKHYRYFLYYEFECRSFHSPIERKDLDQRRGLEVIDLDELTTYGEDIADLLPVPFCDKVWMQVTSKGAEVVDELKAQHEAEREAAEKEAMDLMCKGLQKQLDNDPELRAELEGKVKPW